MRQERAAQIQAALNASMEPVFQMLRDDLPRTTCSVKFFDPTRIGGFAPGVEHPHRVSSATTLARVFVPAILILRPQEARLEPPVSRRRGFARCQPKQHREK